MLEDAQSIGSQAGDRWRWFGLAVVAVAQLMIVVDMTIVNVALPSINADLGISDAERQWIITAYTLPFAGLLLLGGRIADYTGRKRALLIGLFGFAAASAIGGAAVNLEMLLAARAAQGAFAALLAPSSLALLTTIFTDPEERGKAFGVFGGVVAAGSPVGLILGGVLTTFLNWHWVLYVNAPIAVAAALGAMVFLSGSRAEGGTGYDVPGAVLATAGLVTIVYGFSRAAQDGWSSGFTVGLLVAGAALVAAFLAVESRVRHPLLPLSVLRHRGRGGAYLVIALMMTGPFGAYLFVSFFLQRVEEYSALRTGLAFLPLTFGVMLAAAIASQLINRIPPRFVMGSGLILSAVGMALLTRLDVGSAYPTDVLPSLVMIGLGMGVVLPSALNLATFGVGPGHAGVASAMFNVSNQVGASLATALLNTAAAGATAAYLASHGSGFRIQLEAQVQGYNMATLWGAGILAAAGLIALILIDTRLGQDRDTEVPTAEAEPAPARPRR